MIKEEGREYFMIKIKGGNDVCGLFANFKRIINNYFSIRSNTSIIIVYNFITIILVFIFYPIVPTLLNYPPNNEEVSAALGTSNVLQYILLGIYICLVGTVFLIRAQGKLKNWEHLDKSNDADKERIRSIRRRTMNLPIYVFILQIAIVNLPVFIIGIIVTTLNDTPKMVVIKVLMMTISLFSLAAVSTYIFSRRIYKNILIKTYFGEPPEGRRLGLKKNIYMQILPMLVVAILFTSLIGYSRVISEKGNLMYNIYKEMLEGEINETDNIKGVDDAFGILKNVKFDDNEPLYFVKEPNGNITTSDGSILGGYYLYYISKPYNGDRMFDLNADTQGIVKTVYTDTGRWTLGLIFEVASDKTIMFFIVGFIALLLLNIIVLYYVVSSISNDISLVTEGLTDIASGELVDLDKKLPVTSNDEIGDLVIAFNKIQLREKEHIEEMEEQQEIITEQERLASLGQLIGGIAHNMRTPIMSIAGAIEGLRDLVAEYEESIGDKNVTEADHREIAREMTEWLDKMDPYCAYMSDILTAVKEQTVRHDEAEILEFSIYELTKRVELLMINELKRNCCVLKTDYRVDMSIKITGDISVLVQVINNLITNAIQAYDETGQEIEFAIKRDDNKIIFAVKDNGVGIPKEVQNRLFKEMVTTKGKKGTGLGLYISYSNIKARFKGNMWFESEEGKGTTFYISIPVSMSDFAHD